MEFFVCSQCVVLHYSKIRQADRGVAPSGGAERPRPLSDRPRMHESSCCRSFWPRTCPRSHARLLPTS